MARRLTARIRASSSFMPKGLVTRSSAPASSAATLSSWPSRTEMTITGSLDHARRRSITSRPSIPGSPRSTSGRLQPQLWMTIILVIMTEDTLPLATIKARLSEIVDRVERRHERVTLTRNGRPAAVLISPDDLKALEDALEILSNPEAMKEIEEARGEIARGETVSGEDLRAKYLSD